MTLLDLSTAIAALFIVGMIWVRTRMQYVGLVRGASGHKLQLEKAGRLYFASAVALLVVGWFVAPPLGATLWPATAANAAGIGGIAQQSAESGASPTGASPKVTVANPALTRVIWFLLTYYVFIIVHRVLMARGGGVFKVREPAA
jgi:hypothetical protein